MLCCAVLCCAVLCCLCRYPAGLVPAVHHLSQLGVPLYITETGVADSGDERRPPMIESYMEQVGGRARGPALRPASSPTSPAFYLPACLRSRPQALHSACLRSRHRSPPPPPPQVERAVGLGYDLRGVMYWSLVDNFEWNFGFSQKVWAGEAGRGGLAALCGVDGLVLPGVTLPPSPLSPSSQFGVFRWNNDGTQKRIAHPTSAALLKRWFERLPGSVAVLLRERRQASGAVPA